MINYNLKPLFENDLKMVYNLFRPRIEHGNKDAEEYEIKKKMQKRGAYATKRNQPKGNFFRHKIQFF